MDYEFFLMLNTDMVVLTANRRLANQLHREYAHYQKAEGKTVWETPNILPLSAWLNVLWETQNGNPILTDFQERCLWKKISGQPWSSISLIQQAWKNLALWNIPLDALDDQHNDTTDAFLCWAREFKKQCEGLGCLTSAEIPSQLKGRNASSKQCLLIGFDDFPPAVEAFLKTVTNKKIIPQKKYQSIYRTSLETTETEIQAMAQWAKEKFQKDRLQKIGCIIPNLSQVRMPVDRIFNETFLNKKAFNISAAQNLTEFPIIQHAINVLQLCQQERKDTAWETLLQSPYLNLNDDDIDVGALVDERRRETLEIDFPLSALLPVFTDFHTRFPNSTWLNRWRHFLNKYPRPKGRGIYSHMNFACANQVRTDGDQRGALGSPLETPPHVGSRRKQRGIRCANKIKTLPEKQTASDWSNTFITLLKTLGWPGHRTLDSVEHQIFTRFTKALDEFSQCDEIFHQMDYDSALNVFIHQLSTTQFQAEGSDTPVQILGLLEASGIDFDALWVMGLQDETWPPAASPNPFIPHTLQVAHKMPHASAARELEFTVNTMKRLVTSAKEIMLSSPSQQDDKTLRPSRLIEKYPEIIFTISKKTFSANNNLETVEDYQGPIIADTESTQGGSWILKQQAICPFSAFAAIRLNARSPEQTCIGISPQEKGKLLHRILESIWIELKDQNTLLNLPEQQLTKTIETIVSDEIFEATHHFQSDSYKHFLLLEKKRLIYIVKEWLNIEKERPPFTVLEHETKRHVTIGPLDLNLQIDRIDELANGKELIIDYKTGLTNITHWFSDRPSEPQLPLYCAYGQKEYAGAAYAQIRASKMTFKGICEEGFAEAPAAGITSIDRTKNIDEINDWKTMLSHWKSTLTTLSESFHAGNARIEPLETACHFCDLQPLCRVQDDE